MDKLRFTCADIVLWIFPWACLIALLWLAVGWHPGLLFLALVTLGPAVATAVLPVIIVVVGDEHRDGGFREQR